MANLIRITLSNGTNRPISFRHITDDPVDFPPDPPSVTTYTVDVTLEQYGKRPIDVNMAYWKVQAGKDVIEMSEPEKDACDAEMKGIRDTKEIEKRKTTRDEVGGTKSDIQISTEVNSIPFPRLKPEEPPPTSTTP